MPVPSQIAHAAKGFAFNASTLEKSFAGLTEEEWNARPKEGSNPMLWIVGHVIWARGNTVGLLGGAWSRPWTPLFARGVKMSEAADYPSSEELLLAWQEVKASLQSAMEQASDEALAAPAPKTIPSFDGKVSGVLAFLAWHETYHVGQAAYLHCWMGLGQVAG